MAVTRRDLEINGPATASLCTTTMRRTSSRLKSKNHPNDVAQPSDTSSVENLSTTGAKQAQKKRKVSAPAKPDEQKATVEASAHPNPATSKMPKVWKGVKGKRGLLKKLVDMPCDILLEIFGHLTVSDLHTLAVSAKALRAMLLNRSLSYMLWKDVSHSSHSRCCVVRSLPSVGVCTSRACSASVSRRNILATVRILFIFASLLCRSIGRASTFRFSLTFPRRATPRWSILCEIGSVSLCSVKAAYPLSKVILEPT